MHVRKVEHLRIPKIRLKVRYYVCRDQLYLCHIQIGETIWNFKYWNIHWEKSWFWTSWEAKWYFPLFWNLVIFYFFHMHVQLIFTSNVGPAYWIVTTFQKELVLKEGSIVSIWDIGCFWRRIWGIDLFWRSIWSIGFFWRSIWGIGFFWWSIWGIGWFWKSIWSIGWFWRSIWNIELIWWSIWGIDWFWRSIWGIGWFWRSIWNMASFDGVFEVFTGFEGVFGVLAGVEGVFGVLAGVCSDKWRAGQWRAAGQGPWLGRSFVPTTLPPTPSIPTTPQQHLAVFNMPNSNRLDILQKISLSISISIYFKLLISTININIWYFINKSGKKHKNGLKTGKTDQNKLGGTVQNSVSGSVVHSFRFGDT